MVQCNISLSALKKWSDFLNKASNQAIFRKREFPNRVVNDHANEFQRADRLHVPSQNTAHARDVFRPWKSDECD